MEIDFCVFLGDPAYADEDSDLWRDMTVSRAEGSEWLIAGMAHGRPQDAEAIGSELARIWEEKLCYGYLEAHTIVRTPDEVALMAVTQIDYLPLPAVLAERIMNPIRASATWTWHGYPRAVVHIDRHPLPVVSGGAHWGGGLWISAHDLALLGQLLLQRGAWDGQRLISHTWIDQSWTPCPAIPDYGYLWWLNDSQTVFPDAAPTGRCARGNLGRHLLWIDPSRDLVAVSRCGDDVNCLLRELSQAVPPSHTPGEPEATQRDHAQDAWRRPLLPRVG